MLQRYPHRDDDRDGDSVFEGDFHKWYARIWRVFLARLARLQRWYPKKFDRKHRIEPFRLRVYYHLMKQDHNRSLAAGNQKDVR